MKNSKNKIPKNITLNDKKGQYLAEKQKERLKAIETLQKAKEMEHIKTKPIKYLLK